MYEALAGFYDKNIGELNYDRMADFLHTVFYKYRNTGNVAEHPIVLDAGCGTGKCTVKLADKGFDMIGLDVSPEMLQIASKDAKSRDICWICQDMTDMDLFGTVEAVFCMTDTVNHLLTVKELRGFLKKSSLFTEPGGLLVLDFLTPAYFKKVIDGNVFYQEDEKGSIIWEGNVHGKICDYEIVSFSKEKKELYSRSEEFLRERLWNGEEIKAEAKKAGYAFIESEGKDPYRKYYIFRKRKK